MNSTTIINIIFSCLALTISIFSFYWTTLRNKKALFFVRTDSLWTFGRPQFALVNAGKNDVLINSIYCHFSSNNPSINSIPPINVNYPDNFIGVLFGGKALKIVIDFPEPFTNEFALEGIKDDQMGGRYMRQLDIEINWIDMKGNTYKVSVGHSIFGFYESGKISTCRPLVKKSELYKLATRI